MSPVQILPDPDAVAAAAAHAIAVAIRTAVGERGGCRLALAGGTTPRRAYAALATIRDVPWARVTFLFGDERCVPPSDPASNWRMAHEALLAHVPAGEVHRMPGEQTDREAAATAYAALLVQPLDLLLLGLGPDGHIASLFPGSEWLAGRHLERVAAVFTPKPPPWRLTILPRVIREARAILVLATGAEKATAVARALAPEGSESDVPARLARHGTWLLDDAAASELPSP